MRRFILLTLLILVVLFISTTSFAQYKRPGQFEVQLGISLPQAPEEFKDYYKTGVAASGQYVFFPSPRLGIGLFVGFNRFSVDEGAIKADFAPYLPPGASLEVDAKAGVTEFGIGARPYLTSPEASIQFFLTGAAIYNLLKEKATVTYTDPYYGTITAGGEEDENEFGVAVGAGIEAPAGERFIIVINGAYKIIFTEEKNTTFIGITSGLAF